MPRIVVDAGTLETIEQALLAADRFVLVTGEGLRETGAFFNPLSDCPLREEIGNALSALGAVRAAVLHGEPG